MDAYELTETMLDAISARVTTCLDKANAAAQKAHDEQDLSERGRLSSESERWREAAHQLRMAQDECQRIQDEAVAEIA